MVDGGLTDNLAWQACWICRIYSLSKIVCRAENYNLRNIVVVNVNAQSELSSHIDKSADVPGIKEVVNTVINVPIDKTTESTVKYSQNLLINGMLTLNIKRCKIKAYFVNLSLKDLPDGRLKNDVLNIGTSFYLPQSDVDKLREAAKILLEQSKRIS